MAESLIKSISYLGLKEEGHSAVPGDRFSPVSGLAGFSTGFTDKPKTTQPDTDLYNAHKV
jgi:hypothetical protein